MSTTVFDPQDLAQAFGILLGRPLDEYDPASTYAVYVLPLVECFGGFEVLTPENLAAETLPSDVHKELDEGVDDAMRVWEDDGFVWYATRSLDLSTSLFVFTDDFPDEVTVPFGVFKAASLPCAHEPTAVLTGRALASLGAQGVDMTTCDNDEYWVPYGLTNLAIRVVSDGTLFDAMAAATGTKGEITPRTFARLPYATGPDRDWVEDLSRLPDPVLREHLATYCLDGEDARCEYWYHVRPGETDDWHGFPYAESLGWEVVTSWAVTEGPGASIVVVRMPPGTEPPATGTP